MKDYIDKHKLGLVFGIFAALVSLIWAVGVAISPSAMQRLLDWVYALHFMKMIIVVTQFYLSTALLLIVIAFLCGYLCGWVLAWIANFVWKK